MGFGRQPRKTGTLEEGEPARYAGTYGVYAGEYMIATRDPVRQDAKIDALVEGEAARSEKMFGVMEGIGIGIGAG